MNLVYIIKIRWITQRQINNKFIMKFINIINNGSKINRIIRPK